MADRNRDRDDLIRLGAESGMKPARLAYLFGLSVKRVGQILWPALKQSSIEVWKEEIRVFREWLNDGGVLDG